LHSSHSDLPPVPSRRFSFSMLLPVLHDVLSWYTGSLIEFHGDVFTSLCSFLPGPPGSDGTFRVSNRMNLATDTNATRHAGARCLPSAWVEAKIFGSAPQGWPMGHS